MGILKRIKVFWGGLNKPRRKPEKKIPRKQRRIKMGGNISECERAMRRTVRGLWPVLAFLQFRKQCASQSSRKQAVTMTLGAFEEEMTVMNQRTTKSLTRHLQAWRGRLQVS